VGQTPVACGISAASYGMVVVMAAMQAMPWALASGCRRSRRASSGSASAMDDEVEDFMIGRVFVGVGNLVAVAVIVGEEQWQRNSDSGSGRMDGRRRRR
jgi:hypothetical protein